MDKQIKWFVVSIFLITGMLLMLWHGKRRFDRRNTNGVEQFRSYTGKVMTQLADGIILWTGLFLIAGGIGFVVFSDNSPESWLALPVLIIVTKFISKRYVEN